jgi:hypothetical protein
MTKFCTKNLNFESDNKHFDLIINDTIYSGTSTNYAGLTIRCFEEAMIGTYISKINEIQLNDLDLKANPNFPYESITTSGNGWGIMLHFHMPYYEFTTLDLVCDSYNGSIESTI